jgi:hypothetical protein
MHQRRRLFRNDIRETFFESILRGWGQRIGSLTLSLDVRCVCLCIRSKEQSPEFEFATVTSELLEQAMEVLPVLFASVPHVGSTQLDQRGFGNRAHERRRGRKGGLTAIAGHVRAII